MICQRIVKVTVVTATVLVVLALFGERQSLERYQSVIDRQMFGPLPPNFDPTKSPSEVSARDALVQEQELTKEQEQVKSSIRFSVINVTPVGDTVVGFTDNSDAKNPKHYYLKVGESRDGWTVKEADPLAAKMTIAKGDVEVSLEIGGNSASGGTTRNVESANHRENAAPIGRSGLLGGRMSSASGGSLGSLRERRAQRAQQQQAAAQAAAEEKERLAEEREKEKAQREAEKEAERAEREKEREETQKRIAEMAEELKRQREASAAAKEKEEGSGGEEFDNKEGDGES